MFACKYCGHGVEMDDDWHGGRRIRDPDTQLPHRCSNTPREYSFRPRPREFFMYDNNEDGEIKEKPIKQEFICLDHLIPTSECPMECKHGKTMSKINFDELQRLMD